MAEKAQAVGSVTDKIRKAIYKNPKPLLLIQDEGILSAIDTFLPYSVGMEFECHKKPSYREKDFSDIPNIMSIGVDDSEQRYRIPNGLKGLCCLYDICEAMKKNSLVDLYSSNHYHTDLGECFSDINSSFIAENDGYILESIKTWGTATELENARAGGWYKYNDLGTLEVRIGEPSFEYSVIVNRVIQCGELARYVRSMVGATPEERELWRLRHELAEAKEELVPRYVPPETPIERVKAVVQSRTSNWDI